MPHDLDRILAHLHRRVLAIALGASLTGCAADEAGSDPQPATTDPVVRDELPDPPARPVASAAARPPGVLAPGRPVVEYAPVIEVLGPVNPGHVVEVLVHDAPFDARVALYTGATPLTEGFAGSDGVASLRFLVPTTAAAGPWPVQALAELGDEQWLSQVLEVEVVEVVADFPLLSELHPQTADEDLVPRATFRACVPREEYAGVCPPVEDFHLWQALEVVSYALDRPLAPGLSALACVPETAFVEDCCYGLELWDAVNGSARDACIPPAPDVPPPTGGGGGGGGGGGYVKGRPFVVADEARVAPVRPAEGWCAPLASAPIDDGVRARVVQAWIGAAQAEHASVASFARLALELLALGAPADLVERATAAQLDEIRHAREAFGVASALSGAAIAPGALVVDGALGRSVREVLVSAVLEGCVGETVSAVQVLEASRRATDPRVAKVLADTAADELRHAELSWALVRWLLDQHPELAGAASDAFASVELGPRPAADPDARALAGWGVLSDRDLHAVAEDVVARVVAPAARALLASCC